MQSKSKNTIKIAFLASVVSFAFSFQISSASVISRENVVDLVNYSRAKEGLSVLVENSKLNEAALEKARDMIQNNYFAHTSPKNVTPWFWFEKNKYDYKYAGENLAINFQNAEEEHEAWMESADHRKNILNPKFQEIGVAVEKGIIDGRMSTVAVQMFGTSDESVVMAEKANGSLELLNRELESGPWGQLAFVRAIDQNKVAGEEKISLPSPVENKFSSESTYWISFFEGLSILLILSAVAANPLILGWLIVKRRKPKDYDIVYPIKLAVIK
jgi:uncharacterized protein YkwD